MISSGSHCFDQGHKNDAIKYIGVLRDTARAPQPPTDRAPNEPVWPICAQERIFWAKFGRFWAKNLNFTGGDKSFGTQVMENHLGTLFALFFGQELDQMGQIWPFLGQKFIFWGAGSKNFGTLI